MKEFCELHHLNNACLLYPTGDKGREHLTEKELALWELASGIRSKLEKEVRERRKIVP